MNEITRAEIVELLILIAEIVVGAIAVYVAGAVKEFLASKSVKNYTEAIREYDEVLYNVAEQTARGLVKRSLDPNDPVSENMVRDALRSTVVRAGTELAYRTGVKRAISEAEVEGLITTVMDSAERGIREGW